MTSHSQSSILITVLNQNFESLKNVLVEINLCFKMIYLTKSCCSNDLHNNNRYQPPNSLTVYQVRKNSKNI